MYTLCDLMFPKQISSLCKSVIIIQLQLPHFCCDWEICFENKRGPYNESILWFHVKYWWQMVPFCCVSIVTFHYKAFWVPQTCGISQNHIRMAMKDTSEFSIDIRRWHIKGCAAMSLFTFFKTAFNGFKTFKLGVKFSLPIGSST